MAYGDEQDDTPEPDEKAPAEGSRLTKKQMEAICNKAKACWKNADASDQRQLVREKEDMRFYAGEQWPESAIRDRQGQAASGNMPAIPARPRLTINQLRQPVRQLQNQERNAHLAAELIPADDFGLGTPEDVAAEIELREGLYRKCQRDSEAQAAHSWTFDRVAQAGRGFWRMLIEPVSPRSFDNQIVIKRIYNQSSVRLDPSHVEPDGSDAKWGLIAVDMSEEAYEAEFPDSKLTDLISADEFTGLMSETGRWVGTDGEGQKVIRVAEYFWTTYETKTLCWFNGGAYWKEELPTGAKAEGPPNPLNGRPTKPRQVEVPSIKWAKVNGANEVLAYEDWAGRYIPIIKEVGEELQPFDDDRRCEGLVRPGISSQEGFNFMVSAMVEAIARAPLAPVIASLEQIEGFEEWYEKSATVPIPYLPYNAVSESGKTLPPPHRDVVEPAIQAIAFGLSTFKQAGHDTTGVPEASLGNVDPSIKSGRAILALQKQAQMATSNYLDNHARSIRHEARMFNDLVYPVYGMRPGRNLQMVTPQGETETRVVGAPGQPAMPGQQPKPVVLTDRDFSVAIKVGKAFDVRNEEGAAAMSEVFAANPNMMGAFADIWFGMQTFPGAKDAKERAELLLPPPVQKYLAEKRKGTDPRAKAQMLEAQMQQQGQMLEAMTARLKEQQMAIEGDTIKQAGETERARLKIESEERIAQLKAQTELLKTEATINAQKATQDVNAKLDLITASLEDRHEMLMSDMSHRQTLEQGQQAHDQGLEAQTAGQEGQMAQSVLDNSLAPSDTEPPA